MTMNSPEAQTKHVNLGDKSAEFVDRRDQPGQAFDDNVNEHTISGDAVGNETAKSDTINERNLYSTPENRPKTHYKSDGSIPSVGSGAVSGGGVSLRD